MLRVYRFRVPSHTFMWGQAISSLLRVLRASSPPGPYSTCSLPKQCFR